MTRWTCSCPTPDGANRAGCIKNTFLIFRSRLPLKMVPFGFIAGMFIIVQAVETTGLTAQFGQLLLHLSGSSFPLCGELTLLYGTQPPLFPTHAEYPGKYRP